MRTGVLVDKFRKLPEKNRALLILINRELGFTFAAGLLLYMIDPEQYADFPDMLEAKERDVLDSFIEALSAPVKLQIAV